MKVIYIASTCSRKKYAEYVESQGARVSQQAQKYNLLLAEGFAENGCEVSLISTRPINRTVSKKLWFPSEKETENGIDFSYVSFVNCPVFRNLFVFFGVFFRVLFDRTSRREAVVVCDALNIVAAMAALLVAACKGYTTVGIVTDVPCHMADMGQLSFAQKLNLWIMKRFQAYLLLTEQMCEVVNPKHRPYIVLEGHADRAMTNVENTLEQKSDKLICLYAGTLKRIYGIKSLVDGFVAANIPNSELHIYGNGNFVDELKTIARENSNVKYFGIAPNAEIVRAELKATLLINPRPSHEEYTKYSFPSKNMEYMASGTPVLTTRLPGMPEDHKPYVYFIEREDADGIKEALQRVLSQDVQSLHAFGAEAKSFILREKNNVAQAAKILKFMSEHL